MEKIVLFSDKMYDFRSEELFEISYGSADNRGSPVPAPSPLIIAAMDDDSPPPHPTVRAITPVRTQTPDEKILCDRCGAEMYRMHAVWRCPACGFKTDCCGW